MATHSSVLAWRIPGTGEPGVLPSLGSHRVGHDWSDLAVVAAAGSRKTVKGIHLMEPDNLLGVHCAKPSQLLKGKTFISFAQFQVFDSFSWYMAPVVKIQMHTQMLLGVGICICIWVYQEWMGKLPATVLLELPGWGVENVHSFGCFGWQNVHFLLYL